MGSSVRAACALLLCAVVAACAAPSDLGPPELEHAKLQDIKRDPAVQPTLVPGAVKVNILPVEAGLNLDASVAMTAQLPPSADPTAALSRVVATLSARGVTFTELLCSQHAIFVSGIEHVSSKYPGVTSWLGYLTVGLATSGQTAGFTAPYITSRLVVQGGPPHTRGPIPPSPPRGDCPKGLVVPTATAS